MNSTSSERRRAWLPKLNPLIAKAPGLFRRAAERLDLRQADLAEAIKLSTYGEGPALPGGSWLLAAGCQRIFVKKIPLFGDSQGLITSQTTCKDENLTMADSSE